MFKLFFPGLMAWLDQCHQHLVAVACIQLLRQRADPYAACETDREEDSANGEIGLFDGVANISLLEIAKPPNSKQ